MITKEDYEKVIDQDSAELESLCNLSVGTMLVGELTQNLDRLRVLEKRLNINLTGLDDLNRLEKDNTKLEEF